MLTEHPFVTLSCLADDTEPFSPEEKPIAFPLPRSIGSHTLMIDNNTLASSDQYLAHQLTQLEPSDLSNSYIPYTDPEPGLNDLGEPMQSLRFPVEPTMAVADIGEMEGLMKVNQPSSKELCHLSVCHQMSLSVPHNQTIMCKLVIRKLKCNKLRLTNVEMQYDSSQANVKLIGFTTIMANNPTSFKHSTFY